MYLLAASLANVVLALDAQHGNLGGDIVTERLTCEGGSMRPPAKPGLGVTLDASKLAQFQTEDIRDAYLDRDKPDWFPVKPQY